jgi:hypothetical protein
MRAEDSEKSEEATSSEREDLKQKNPKQTLK